MLKNSKHIIIFVLAIATILLLVLTSLAASKSSSQIDKKNKSTSVHTDKNVDFGICLFSTSVTSTFDSYVDTLLVNGFTILRVDIPNYQDTVWMDRSKAAVIRAIARGVKVIWGVSSNPGSNPAYTITSSNWPNYKQAILDAARWAQDNGVYEFQIGNEEEYHNDNTTLTDTQLITNLKSVATEVKAIFTRGNISYSCLDTNVIQSAWISAGKGDIDILASNIYKGGSEDSYDTSYQIRINNLINAFGVNGTYLTEFGPSYTSLAHYSTDETTQAAALTEMISYINTSGMTRAIFYDYADDDFGAMYENGTYRKLWESLTSVY